MATCPSGHESVSDDFCDVCGVLIGAAPALGLDQPPSGGGVVAASATQSSSRPASGAGQPGAEACPRCGVTRAGQFCESCGYDYTATAASFAPPESAWAGNERPAGLAPVAQVPAGLPASAVPPAPVPPAPEVPSAPATVLPPPKAGPPVPDGDVHWAAVVTADRDYYDSVQAAGGPDAAGIGFPLYYPHRQFALSGTEMRIGRRSVSSGISPEIDLSVPPADPGVSRLHAVLLRPAGGSWAVMDPGSANGTLVNGSEIPEGQAVPVRPGDRIHVGAWTAISIVDEA